MQLTVDRLRLVNFRSYSDARFEFGQRTVVVGRNTAGKTNLLESLYLLSASKSFRADREREMVRWGERGARVEAGVTHRGAHTVVCQLEAGERTVKKTFLVDGAKRKAAELSKIFPAALFSGDDVRLIDGSPGRRRRTLDLLIGQGSAVYLDSLRRYGRVVASRNRLLEQIAAGESGSDELDFWDRELITHGQVVLDGRRQFAEFANNVLPELYQGIAPAGAPPLELALKTLSDDLAVDLPGRRDQDIAVGTTTLGPHRDDWSILLGNRPLVSFGSGGEFRSAVLSFRMAEVAWLKAQLTLTPILLLDDVFSELDRQRRDSLLANLPESQTIITTPQLADVPESFGQDASVITIGEEARV